MNGVTVIMDRIGTISNGDYNSLTGFHTRYADMHAHCRPHEPNSDPLLPVSCFLTIGYDKYAQPAAMANRLTHRPTCK